MRLEVNIGKKNFFIILTSLILLFGALGVYAYNDAFSKTANQATTFGHSADELVVKMGDGSLKTVQELLSGGVGTSGIGGFGAWTPVPLSGTDSFDLSCQYRFKFANSPLTKPSFDLITTNMWFYVTGVDTDNLIYIAHNTGGYNKISAINKNKKNTFIIYFDQSSYYEAHSISTIEKKC